jgi:hypothetical protein
VKEKLILLTKSLAVSLTSFPRILMKIALLPMNQYGLLVPVMLQLHSRFFLADLIGSRNTLFDKELVR